MAVRLPPKLNTTRWMPLARYIPEPSKDEDEEVTHLREELKDAEVCIRYVGRQELVQFQKAQVGAIERLRRDRKKEGLDPEPTPIELGEVVGPVLDGFIDKACAGLRNLSVVVENGSDDEDEKPIDQLPLKDQLHYVKEVDRILTWVVDAITDANTMHRESKKSSRSAPASTTAR